MTCAEHNGVDKEKKGSDLVGATICDCGEIVSDSDRAARAMPAAQHVEQRHAQHDGDDVISLAHYSTSLPCAVGLTLVEIIVVDSLIRWIKNVPSC